MSGLYKLNESINYIKQINNELIDLEQKIDYIRKEIQSFLNYIQEEEEEE